MWWGAGKKDKREMGGRAGGTGRENTQNQDNAESRGRQDRAYDAHALATKQHNLLSVADACGHSQAGDRFVCEESGIFMSRKK